MRPHPKIRKTIKWGGAAMTVLLVVVWVGSGWWPCSELSWSRPYEVGLTSGAVYLAQWNVLYPGGEAAYPFGNDTPRLRWWIVERSSAIGWRVAAPLWLPGIMSLVFTLTAWRLDTLASRRARTTHCPKCNYDRAGIGADAVCPECGSKGGPA